MSDLIDRQAAIQALDNAAELWNIAEPYHEGIRAGYKNSARLIMSLPSAQPEITLESAIDYLHSIGWMQEHDRTLTESAQPERKRGKWIYRPEIGWGEAWVCSECEEITQSAIMGKPRYNYCPNCGSFNGGAE